MKNKNYLFVIVIFVLIFSISITACDLLNDEDYFEGTWEQVNAKFKFTGNEFYYNRTLISGIQGTFTCNKSKINFNTTHTYSSGGWVELKPGSTGGAGDAFDGRDISYGFGRDKTGRFLDIKLGGIWSGKYYKK